MSRDERNRQVNVPLPRGSDMERFYEEEAKEWGVKLPTHWYQLLKDRYEALQGKGQGIWFPRGTPVPPQETPIQPGLPNKASVVFQMFGGEDKDDDESPTEPHIRVVP